MLQAQPQARQPPREQALALEQALEPLQLQQPFWHCWPWTNVAQQRSTQQLQRDQLLARLHDGRQQLHAQPALVQQSSHLRQQQQQQGIFKILTKG